MSYRNHPILDNLKVNEEGTSIIYKDEPLISKSYERKSNSVPMEVVAIRSKTVTVMRLVCECWHGMPENLEFVVKKIDQSKGNHYSNLCWSKQGLGLSHNSKSAFGIPIKYSEEQFRQLQSERAPDESVNAFLKRKNIGSKIYYATKKRYE